MRWAGQLSARDQPLTPSPSPHKGERGEERRKRHNGEGNAMPGPGLILKDIHRLRRHIKDLESKIEGGPRQLKAQQSKIAKDEENLKKAQEALKQSKVKIHDKEVSVKATQTEIQKYEQQL